MTFFQLNELWPYYQKGVNLKSLKSLKLSFTNIRGFRSNFVECESFLESNFPDVIALCEINLDDSIDSTNFSVRNSSSFNPKGFCYSFAWSWGLFEGRISLYRGLISRKLCRFSLIISTGFNSLSVLLLSLLLITFVFVHGFFMLFHLTQMLLINPTSNALVFGDFYVDHKVWLTYSGGNGRPSKLELCYNLK